MDFNPTETQLLLSDMVTGLLESEYSFEIRRRMLISGKGHAPALWAKLAELGILGVEIDEALGGSGGSFEDLASILGPFGRSLVTEPFLATVVLGAGLIAALGSDEQKKSILPDVASGKIMLALAHAERQARDAIHWVGTRAERTADGWRLSGEKAVILGGDLASIFIVSARTAGEIGDPEGISLFIARREAPDLNVRSYSLYDGSGAADLTFDGLTVGPEDVLGDVGNALGAIELAYDRARAAICAEAVGVMERLREITLDYLRTRVQFGQPIGKFQALQHRMVDAHVEVELARSMALLAIDAVGEADSARRARSIAAAKAHIGSAARSIGQSAVQLHGGIALTDEYSAGHYFKRLTMIERLFGDVEYNTKRFASIAA